MTKKAPAKPQKESGAEPANDVSSEKAPTSEVWTLEDAFPEVNELLSPSQQTSAANGDVLVVLDTNALLLPFRVGTQELPKIEEVYRKLIASKQLFVPARVIREFVKNRDSRLAEIAKGLRDRSSATNSGGAEIPPLLSSLPETNAVVAAVEKLRSARKEYLDAISGLVDRIRGWRGDDPVTSIYHKLFTTDVIIDVDESRQQIEKAWKERLRNKTPPGYKDGSKSDTGIGDFAIWLVLLKLGRLHKKSLIFVTGEEKADWFVRADSEGVYPRPELVDEFRRASSGKHLQLSKLADVLSDLKAPDEVVQEVREAEAAANAAVQVTGAVLGTFTGGGALSELRISSTKGFVTFDYSTNDGTVAVAEDMARFVLKFSKGDDESIYFYRSRRTPFVARAKNVRPGDVVMFESFDSSSRVYTIHVGELFLAKNINDYVIAGRIHRIMDDTRGASRDEVSFAYSIFGPGEQIVVP